MFVKLLCERSLNDGLRYFLVSHTFGASSSSGQWQCGLLHLLNSPSWLAMCCRINCDGSVLALRNGSISLPDTMDSGSGRPDPRYILHADNHAAPARHVIDSAL